MFHVCPGCEQWIERFDADVDAELIRCPVCGTTQRFGFRPLLVLLGASASGKSAVARELVGRDIGPIVLEQDILWAPEFDHPDDGYRRFRETWLRLVANVHQAGIDTLLVGSGAPDQFEQSPSRNLFSSAHYAALICTEGELRRRLVARPAWRESSDDTFLERMLEYNAWLRSEATSSSMPIKLIDTTHEHVEETTDKVAVWMTHNATSAD